MEVKNLLIEQDRKISELTASDTIRPREIQPAKNQMTNGGQTVKVGVLGLDEVATSEEVEQAIMLAFRN
ncbi:hypothetical protein ACI65C_000009 [Semiaphis heraclei]